MRLAWAALFLPLLLPLSPSVAGVSVVGVSKRAESLTLERVNATLAPAERGPWLEYLRRSAQQLSFDQDDLAMERNRLAPPYPGSPQESSGVRSIPLDREPAFYRTAEALHTAATILSFQVPNGGWSKNLNMAGPARASGQSWAANNLSRFLGPDDFDQPANPDWNYLATLDNDATNTELHFLARMSTAWPAREGDEYRRSLVRGVYYLLRAQYPNGGWPQVYPLEGGYHDAVTFNDNAVTESATTLAAVAAGQGDYRFIPADLRAQSQAAEQRAVAIILRSQVVVHGERTVWAQQHDSLTLAPVAGRNFEPAALSASESADILIFLMKLPHPSAEVRTAIESGIRWLQAHAIYGEAWEGGRGRDGSTTPQPRHLQATPGAGPIWARFYAVDTGKPVFGDRDKTIHSSVDELSTERRNGYAWYNGGANAALLAYGEWKRGQPTD